MCFLVMSLRSCDDITYTFNGSRYTGLTCGKAPNFWIIEHQFVIVKNFDKICCFSHKFILQQDIIYIIHPCIVVNHALTDFSILGFAVSQDGDSFYTSK